MKLFLVACGDDSSNNNESDETLSNEVEEASAEETEQDDSDADEEANDEEEEQTDEVSDSYLDTGDYIYKIKEIEQVESKFGDGTRALAIELAFTINSYEPKSAWMSLGLAAEQSTETTVEELDGENTHLPEDYKPDLAELWTMDIKPGATVDVVIAFEILYPGEPVRLYDRFGDISGNSTFERIVETE